MKKQEDKYRLDVKTPKVTLLHATPLFVAELGARIAYDSFKKSENEAIREYPDNLNLEELRKIESSDILNQLAWVYNHHSVLEHINFSFLIRRTSRSCLQEQARHRIQSLTVRSTRYTMSTVLNAFVVAYMLNDAVEQKRNVFYELLFGNDELFVISNKEYLKIEINTMYDKLTYSLDVLEFTFEDMLSKDQLEVIKDDLFLEPSLVEGYLTLNKGMINSLYEKLNIVKQKRNVGDAFKHIVTDNWSTDLVVTINMRSLRNYFNLRDSGGAFFHIQWLAQEMKKVIPSYYLKYIIKENR